MPSRPAGALLLSGIDVGDDVGRRRDAPVHVPAHAVVDRQVVGDAPVVADPQRPRRTRNVDAPVAGVEVLVELAHRRGRNAGDVPACVGSSLGKSALRLAGFELKSMRPTCWMYQVPVLLHVDELAADLEVVLVGVPAQVVARLEVVLVEQLRVVVRLADGQADEVVFDRVLARAADCWSTRSCCSRRGLPAPSYRSAPSTRCRRCWWRSWSAPTRSTDGRRRRARTDSPSPIASRAP